MKLTQCAQGHFYDAEKFGSCPHCGGGSSAPMGGGEDQKTDAFFGTPSYAGANMGSPMSDVNVTQGFGSNMGGYQSPINPVGGGGYSNENNETIGFTQPPLSPANGYQQMPGMNRPIADEGKTVAYMSWQAQNSPQNAQAPTVPNAAGQPVVGWLVCVDGSNYGSCFNLYGGKNFIGRSADMDICLAGDSTISRVKHAIVVYEPKGRVFFAQPGESHELFYVNNNVVLESTILKDRDVITVGKTTLVFVPFCDSRYGWENKG